MEGGGWGVGGEDGMVGGYNDADAGEESSKRRNLGLWYSKPPLV